MGEMLATFRALPIDGLEIDQSWAHPARLAARACEWGAALQELDDSERATLADELTRVPELFRGRPVVLAHGGYFSPVNVLSDGRSTGAPGTAATDAASGTWCPTRTTIACAGTLLTGIRTARVIAEQTLGCAGGRAYDIRGSE